MKKFLFLIVSLFVFMGCENLTIEPEVGTIQGLVTIGPLCGNVSTQANSTNPCGFTNEQLDAIYNKYTVEIKSAQTGKLIENSIILYRIGVFRVKVPVGAYIVEVIPPAGINVSSSLMNEAFSLKKGVNVLNDEVVKLSFNVNLGTM